VNESLSPHQSLARRIADRFTVYASVEAIALAGSQTAGIVDQTSDIDLYVYTTAQIPLQERVALVDELKASRADLGSGR
jgi:predicted nucleotidyltransferase